MNCWACSLPLNMEPNERFSSSYLSEQSGREGPRGSSLGRRTATRETGGRGGVRGRGGHLGDEKTGTDVAAGRRAGERGSEARRGEAHLGARVQRLRFCASTRSMDIIMEPCACAPATVEARRAAVRMTMAREE